ncbi:MAG: nucleoside-diphosphate kinase [Hadesarchaea archaeon]|nr:nucleoside-diphosphate kinase [Hadesarchaea archaeon]
MIKPDGVRKRLIDEIISRIERAGLSVVAKRRLILDRGLAERLYSVHQGKPFFERLVDHVLSGEVVVMIVEGEQAVSRMRELIGATDPAKAAKGTIRGDFATSVTENIIHAADSLESARREISLFF